MANSTAEGLDAVLDCLRVVIGSLLYARDVLPLKAYENMRLGSESPLFFFHPIKPGSSKRADFLLNWLEDPITQAIDRGVLKAFQICIHPDSTRRSKVVETYTFSVRKTDHEDVVKPQHSNSTNAVSKYPHLWPIINKIQEAGGRAPAMLHKFLTVNLFFENDNSDLRWLKGFDKSAVKNCAFPQANGWQKKTETFPVMEVGGYEITATMSYMQGSNVAHDKLEAKREFPTYGTSAKFTDDILKAAPAAVSVSTISQDYTDDIGMGLRNIANPLQPTQGDTQSVSRSMPYAATQTQPTNTIPRRGAPADAQLVFKENQIYVNRRDRSIVKAQVLDVWKMVGGNLKDGRKVLCICGFTEKEGHMVQCACCGLWQHLHCFGYVNDDDPRRPDTHYCYKCFINPQSVHSADELIALASYRRAMFHIVQHGMGTKGDFKAVMNLDMKVSNKIIDKLKQSNHIAAAQGSHRAGYAASGLPHYVAVKGALFNTTLDAFFDPTKHVRDFFERPNYRPSQLAEFLHFPPEDANVKKVEAAVPPQQRKAAAAVTPPAPLTEAETAGQKRAFEEAFVQDIDAKSGVKRSKFGSGQDDESDMAIYQTSRIISALRGA